MQSKQSKRLYYVVITDVYSGEANYSWVTRHIIRAESERGAIQALSYRSGINWRKVYDTGDHSRYDSRSGATCAFISDYVKGDYQIEWSRNFETDDRIKGE